MVETSRNPSLSGLFPLSDPWNSSHAPSHRPSTFELCDFYLCLLVKHIRIKTLLVTRGECPENLTLPISNGHLPSDHNFHLYSFVGLRLNKNWEELTQQVHRSRSWILSHSLVILYQILSIMSSFFSIFFSVCVGHLDPLQPFPTWFFVHSSILT